MIFMAVRNILFPVLLTLTLCILLASGARAVQPDEVLQDPLLEARARAISEGLRCLVCQNQSIDDSEAPLAKDLRLLVRERLKQGDSDQQVVDFIVARVSHDDPMVRGAYAHAHQSQRTNECRED